MNVNLNWPKSVEFGEVAHFEHHLLYASCGQGTSSLVSCPTGAHSVMSIII